MHIPPDWGTFALLIVSFLIFWFIFNRIFFQPFLNLLTERERRFKSLTERTEHLIKQAGAAEQERERRLAMVRREALQRRDIERRNAENEAARMLEEAKAQTRATLEDATARVEHEIRAAEKDAEVMARSLASELAERLLGRPLGSSGNSGMRN